MSDEPTQCPVCSVDFGNPGACATHMQRTKDAPHTAHRINANASHPASTDANAPHDATAPHDAVSRINASSDAGESSVGDAMRQTDAMRDTALRDAGLPAFFEGLGNALPSPVPVEPERPSSPSQGAVAPLMPPASPDAKTKAASIVVPLGPIVAGATAAAINGLILNQPRDQEISVEQVQSTHFPDAVEACLRLYFPELPLDHPITALIASGASLSILVVQLKGKNQTLEPTPAPQQSTVQSDAVEDARTASAPSASTGDAYWDAILRNQGGGVRA